MCLRCYRESEHLDVQRARCAARRARDTGCSKCARALHVRFELREQTRLLVLIEVISTVHARLALIHVKCERRANICVQQAHIVKDQCGVRFAGSWYMYGW